MNSLGSFTFISLLVFSSWTSLSYGYSFTSLSSFENPIEKQQRFPNIQEFVRNTTTEAWNRMEVSELEKFDCETLRNLEFNNQGIIPERIRKQCGILKIEKCPMSINQVKNFIRGELGPVKLRQIMRKLPQPAQFNKSNVTNLQYDVFKLGYRFLSGITDTEAIKELKLLLKRAYDSGNAQKRKELGHMKKLLFLGSYGDPHRWTKEDLMNMDLTSFDIGIVRNVDAEVLMSAKDDLIREFSGLEDSRLRRTIVEKLLKARDFSEIEDPQEARTFIDGLGSFKNDIICEDFKHDAVKEMTYLKNLCNQNFKRAIENGRVNAKSVWGRYKEIAKKKTITKEYIQEIGTEMLAFGSPSALKEAIGLKAFEENDIADLASALQNRKGAAIKNQLRLLAKLATDFQNDRRDPSVQYYPSEVVSMMSPAFLSKVSGSDAKNTLSKDGANVLDYARTSILLRNVNNFNGMSRNARGLVAMSKIKDFSSFNLIPIARDLAASNPVCKLLVEKAFPKSTRVIDVSEIGRQAKEVLDCMGAKEAQLFEQKDIMKTLAKLNEKGIEPSIEACIVLQQKYLNYSTEVYHTTNSREAVERITLTDIKEMPVCVVAVFGANNLWHLEVDQKITLLERLGKMKNSEFTIAREARQAIVKNALEAFRGGGGFQPMEQNLLGSAIIDMTGSMISKTDIEFVADLVEKMTKFIAEKGRSPCFDSSQRNSLGGLIKKFKGMDLTMWGDVSDFGCLLQYLEYNDLQRIPDEPMSMSKCKSPNNIPIEDDVFEALCKASIGESDYERMEDKEEELEELQRSASLRMYKNVQDDSSQSNRKKREIMMMDSCSKASFGGANALEIDELEDFTFTKMKKCLPELGGTKMDLDRATILARKAREGANNNLRNFNASVFESLNYILPGFSISDLNKLPLEGSDDLVSVIGQIENFRKSQRDVLANNVMLQWKSPSSMTSADICTVKHLICSFDAPDIDSFRLDVLKESLPCLREILKKCELYPVIEAFAKLAKRAHESMTTWTKATVAEMGVIIAGHTPEDLIKIPVEAWEGLSPSAVEMFSTDLLLVLSVDKLKFFPISTSRSISDSQKSILPPEMLRSLERNSEVFQEESRRGKASAIVSVNSVLFFAMLMKNVLFF